MRGPRRAGVHKAGLTSAAAAERLAEDGLNVLPTAKHIPAWVRLAAQMTHFFAVMLWLAGGLAFVAGMPQLGIVDRLRDLLPARATVRRDGRRCEIPSDELVRGDIVLLEPGDRISADLELLEAHALSVDALTLTGESVSVELKATDPAFAGTFVVTGEGEAIVVATGAATRLGGIAELTGGARRPPGPLEGELQRVVRIVAGMAVGIGTGFLVLSLLLGESPGDGFLFAIGVTVALVPEGLRWSPAGRLGFGWRG